MAHLNYGHRRSAVQRLKPYLRRWWSYTLMVAILVAAFSPWLYYRIYLGNHTIDLYGRIVDLNGQALAGATVSVHVAQLDAYCLYDRRYIQPCRFTEADYTVIAASDGRFELHGVYGRYVYINGVKVNRKGFYPRQPRGKEPYTGPDMDYGRWWPFTLPSTRSRELTIAAEQDQRYYWP